MAAVFYFSIFIPLVYFSVTEERAIDSTAIAGCLNKCGDVEISYPFGIGEPRCFLNGFEVVCIQNIPYLQALNFQLLEIFQGEVSINSTGFIAKTCPPTAQYGSNSSQIQLPERSPYTISVTSNKFIAIGCSTVGMVSDISVESDQRYSSVCATKGSFVNGSCEGHGYCTAPLPELRKLLVATITQQNSSVRHCSYGFIVEDGSYTFRESDILDFDKTADISMRLAWSIGGSCNYERGALVYACGGNTTCAEISGRYQCYCPDGYEGNPYLNGSLGCQDVDECNKSFGSSCVEVAKCQNMIPGFRCLCPEGSYGDGRIGGLGCIWIYRSLTKSYNRVPTSTVTALLGTLFCVGSITMCFFGCRGVRREKDLVKIREKFFRKNGGNLLQQQVSSLNRSTKYPKIYSAQELKKATNNFHTSNVLGSGGNGAVYKGILKDGTVVAIKKSQVVDQRHIDQFINEVVILTEINHKNVVKLLGCCLETQVPMLVYEFISNGTLYQKIHEKNNPSKHFTWQSRFRIAFETACALSYLHSSISTPIFHRDIKSSNILLDTDYTPKVADFGISRLVPLDKTRVSTMVLGTFGYLDPEYFNTGKLTEKSDVYSFGVVLLELLTGKKPIWPDPSMDYCNLPMVFLSHVRTDNLVEILDENVVREGRIEELQSVADIAMRCLRVKGVERPKMKEVVQEFIALLNGHAKTQPDCKAHEFEEPGANYKEENMMERSFETPIVSPRVSS